MLGISCSHNLDMMFYFCCDSSSNDMSFLRVTCSCRCVNNYDLPALRRASPLLADAFMLFVSIFIAQIFLGCLLAILMSSFSKAVTGPNSDGSDGISFTIGQQLGQALSRLYFAYQQKFGKEQQRPQEGERTSRMLVKMCEELLQEGVEALSKGELAARMRIEQDMPEDRAKEINQQLHTHSFWFVHTEPPPKNVTGFRNDVDFGDEQLWDEVELLQSENERLRQQLKLFSTDTPNAQDAEASEKHLTHKTGYLRKKGGYGGGSQWIAEGSKQISGLKWEWRWFCITPKYISFYKNHNQTTPAFIMSWVELVNIEIDAPPQSSSLDSSAIGETPQKACLGFALIFNTCRVEVMCYDFRERADWLVSIKECIDELVQQGKDRYFLLKNRKSSIARMDAR